MHTANPLELLITLVVTYLEVHISLFLSLSDGDLKTSIETTSTSRGSITGRCQLIRDALWCCESNTEEGRSQSEREPHFRYRCC